MRRLFDKARYGEENLHVGWWLFDLLFIKHRRGEIGNAILIAFWGIWLLREDSAFEYEVYSRMKEIMPENVWALVFLLAACAQIWAVLAGNTWVRIWMAVTSGISWCFLSALLFLGSSKGILPGQQAIIGCLAIGQALQVLVDLYRAREREGRTWTK